MWTPPVAVSLLLHAALLILVTHQLSATRVDSSREQTITVTLLGQIPMSDSKHHLHVAKSAQQTASPVPAPIVNTAPREAQPTAASAKPTSPSNQGITSAIETKQAGLTVQPLSKLSRPPVFLRKIEPVYPAAEQRAGSQANILAEVTIDENGKVREVRIVKSAGKNFDDAVIDALKKSIFVPGYIDKEAVAVRVFVPFRFNLN